MEYYKNLDLADIKYFCEIDQVEKIEEWRDVEKYEGYYRVSDIGRVKSVDRLVMNRWNNKEIIKSRIMCQHKNDRGYLSVHLSKENVRKHPRVNRLVAIAYIPNPENKPEVGHVFGNKQDNRAVSLKWETRLENMQHAFRTGLITSIKGEDSKSSKLTEKEVLEIRASSLSQKELAKIYNCDPSNIRRINLRLTWKHI